MTSFLTEKLTYILPSLEGTVPGVGMIDITAWVLAFGVFFGAIVIFGIVRKVVLVYLKALSRKTSTDIDDVGIDAISGIRTWVYSIVAFFIAIQFLSLPTSLYMIVQAFFLFAVVWQLIEVVLCFATYGTKRLLEKDEDGDGVIDADTANASHFVTLLIRIVLWALGGLFVLSNLGIEVTSLVAGLGIGGIAVAFALQGILSDLFSSFSLYFDKPFRPGDYIVIGTDAGTVEKIGIKSTRIRTLQGEELVVSNAELTEVRVQNFKKMEERRSNFSFGITYETPHENVKAVPEMVERIYEEVDGVRLDRVHFTSFGDSALMFDVVFYIESAAYSDYLDIQQQVNFKLMDKFAEVGIEFAYPTQTLYVKQ